MRAQFREGISIANQWQLLRPLNEGAISQEYFDRFYAYLAAGGARDVAAYLMAHDLTGFNPKAPPRRSLRNRPPQPSPPRHGSA